MFKQYLNYNTEYETTTENYTETNLTENYSETESETSYTETETDNVKTIILKKKGRIHQNDMTNDDIKKSVENYTFLDNIEKMEILNILPKFKTYIKYFNKKLKKFRVGGVLLKNMYPKYILIGNVFNKKKWSVQLSESILFIKNETYSLYYDKFLTLKKKEEEEIKEKELKDLLYKLYLNNKLKIKS